MTDHPCVTGCGRPADGHFLCRSCSEELGSWLSSVSELSDDLEVARTRLARLGDRMPVASSGPAPLPYDPGATEASDVLANTLLTWMADVADRLGHPQAANPSLGGTARWLRARLTSIRVHPAADELTDEIIHAIRHCWRVVDHRPGTIYMGPCSTEDDDGAACAVDLYARADAHRPGRIDTRQAIVRCPECGTEYDTEARRAWLLDELRETLATASEIASAAGVIAGREINVKTIRTWHSTGRIVGRGRSAEGAPLHRIGDVVDVAAVSATRRRGSCQRSGARA